MHSTHFIYGCMASDIWQRTIQIAREETHCCHMGFSFRLTIRVLLYAPSHRQDNTYHDLYTPVVEHWLEGTTSCSKWCSSDTKYYIRNTLVSSILYINLSAKEILNVNKFLFNIFISITN